MRASAFVLCLLAVAACDTAPVDPVPRGPNPQVGRLAQIPDLEVALGAEATAVDLTPYFRGNDASGPLTYETTLLEGEGVAFTVEGDVLLAWPGPEETDALVRIVATGRAGGAAADTFRAIVRDPCPAAAGPDSTLVLPVAEGMRWAYDLRTSTALTGEPPRRSTGRIQLEVVSAGACSDGQQGFALREQRTETVEWRNPNGGEWEVLSGPTTTERTYRWTVSDTAVRTDAPDFQGRPGAGLEPAPFGREAPRVVPTSRLDADGEVWLTSPSPFGPGVVLRAGMGPVYFGTQTLFGTRGSASEVWEWVE